MVEASKSRRRTLRWMLILLAVLLVLAAGYRVATMDARNAAVAEDIRMNPDGDRAQRSMLIWLADGRMYPVNYLREGNLVFMGIDGLWWRAFREPGQAVTMLIRGEELHGHALVNLHDPAYKADVFSRLRPTVPKWLPDFLNGKLVVITLDEQASS